MGRSSTGMGPAGREGPACRERATHGGSLPGSLSLSPEEAGDLA